MLGDAGFGRKHCFGNALTFSARPFTPSGVNSQRLLADGRLESAGIPEDQLGAQVSQERDLHYHSKTTIDIIRNMTILSIIIEPSYHQQHCRCNIRHPRPVSATR